MDPITAASLFATVVGLIGQYKSEVNSRESKSSQDFRDWLNENKYTDIVDLLCADSETLAGLDKLIRLDHSIFLEKLNSIDSALISLSSSIEGFDSIAKAISPKMGLSSQAVSILKQMEKEQTEAILKISTFGGPQLMVIRGPSSSGIEISEPRFLEADLDSLVKLGLLLIDHNKKNEPFYVITREASNLVNDAEKNS